MANYFAQIFELRTYHSDPHPGNLMAMEHSVVGFLDFGRVSSISEPDRDIAVNLFIALVELDADGSADLIADICHAGPDVDREGLRRDMAGFMSRRYGGATVGDLDMQQIMAEMLEMVRLRGLHMPSQFTMLFHTIGVLDGVVLDLDPELDTAEVGVPYARKLVAARMSPAHLAKTLAKSLAAHLRVIDHLPIQVGDLMAQLSSGRFRVVVRLDEQDALMDRVQAIVNRVAVVFLLSALAIALAIASVGGENGGLLMTAAQILLFLIFAAGAWLFFSLLRHDYTMAKRRKAAKK